MTSHIVSFREKGRRQKTFHVNMLKTHHERTEYVMPVCSRPEQEEADPLLDLLANTQELGADLKINLHLSLHTEYCCKCLWHTMTISEGNQAGCTLQLAK